MSNDEMIPPKDRKTIPTSIETMTDREVLDEILTTQRAIATMIHDSNNHLMAVIYLLKRLP